MRIEKTQIEKKQSQGHLRYILPIISIILLMMTIRWIQAHPKTITLSPKPSATLLQVETQTIKADTFPIRLTRYGRVQGKQRSTLAAQTSLKVIAINPEFEAGRHLKAGTQLVQLDDQQIQADLAVAKAELAQAKANLDEETAKGQQALKDWRQLNGARPAPALALRKPQLASAKANVQAATARLQKTNVLLAQTHILAPYDCLILERQIELGEIASPTTAIGTVISSYHREILLPVTLADTQLLGSLLLRSFNNEKSNQDKSKRYVQLFGTHQVKHPVSGWITGLGDAVTATTQQQVLQVDYINHTTQPENHLIAGEFVTAIIPGPDIENAIVIPETAVYQGNFVYIVDSENTLQRKTVIETWRDEKNVIIQSGLIPGDQLVTTPLGKVVNGTKVKITQPTSTQPKKATS